MMRRQAALLLTLAGLLLAAATGVAAAGGAARRLEPPQLVRYEDLEPLAGVVDVRAAWRLLKLPALPASFCHVGLLGWHCHSGDRQPWDRASLVPQDQLPPMPADASCVICPRGWDGPRRSVIDLLLDWPIVRQTGKLPQGAIYDYAALKAAAAEVRQATAAATAGASNNTRGVNSGAGSAAAGGGASKGGR